MAHGVEPKEQEKLDATLARIANRLLVFSGKGGVGKTSIAVNIAAGLAQQGRKVGLLDVDIHGPNVARMLGADQGRLTVSADGRIVPVETGGGIKLVSIALLTEQGDAPVVWRGPLKMRIITQFVADVDWGDLDWLVIDSPPGTGDEPLSVAQLIPATAAVIVTTPQGVALMDTRKAVNFAQLLKLKVLGVVENMSGFTCPHCGEPIDIFKQAGGTKMAREMLVPVLGRVPLDPRMVDASDEGRPFILEHPDSEAGKALTEVVRRVMESEAK